mgnify:CR=1 FL=1
MATIIINENDLQGKCLLEYIKTLSYASVIDEKKKNFREAIEEHNAVTVSTFVRELHQQIDEHFNKNVY